jgi:hypothetical protein
VTPSPPSETLQNKCPALPRSRTPQASQTWYSRLQAALRQVSASLFTEADVKAAVKSLQNKAPGEDGTPVSVFRVQYKAAEDSGVGLVHHLLSDRCTFRGRGFLSFFVADWPLTKSGVSSLATLGTSPTSVWR